MEKFNSLLEFIRSVKDDKQIVYISVGCAANLIKEEISEGNKKFTLDDRYNQEYPLCIKKIKTLSFDSPLHLILIDPELEAVPFIVRNSNGTEMDTSWIKDCSNGFEMYYNAESKIYVYAVRLLVTYKPYSGQFYNTEIDISNFLANINSIATATNMLVVGNEFRGKNMGEFGGIISETINGHTDHIVYGLGVRGDHGCYINLEDPLNNFACTVNDRISVFNPYNFKTIAEMVDGSLMYRTTDEDEIIVSTQLDYCIKLSFNNIKNVLVPFMRKICLISRGERYTVADWEINNMNNKFNFNATHMLAENKYSGLLDILFGKLDGEIRKIFCYYSKSNLVEEFLHEIMCEFNPYNWLNICDKYFDVIKK